MLYKENGNRDLGYKVKNILLGYIIYDFKKTFKSENVFRKSP